MGRSNQHSVRDRCRYTCGRMPWKPRAWKSSRKRGFSRKWKSKIVEKYIKINRHTFFFMKIKIDLWMQIEGIKLILVMNFSVLHFFKFATRMPIIAQILVSTFKIFWGVGGVPPDPLEISSLFFVSNSRLWSLLKGNCQWNQSDLFLLRL